MHVVLAYAPNSGREGRLEFRLQQWEPSVRALLSRLQRSGKPVLFQGDLNVAHRRELDAWGTTDAEFGHFKASVRTREEAAAFDELLSECELVDGFRFFHPAERSATCWAQKAKGKPDQREHWKRYDYALVFKSRVQPATGRGARLLDVRHRGEVFEAGKGRTTCR
jgi:exodeoxyribonuclease III